MSCIGQRKRDKNSTDISLEANARGISNINSGGATTKRASRLKPPNKVSYTTNSTAGGTATTTTATTKRNATATKKPASPRSSVDGRPTQTRKPRPPLNNQHATTTGPQHRRPLSPQTSPRQSMVSSTRKTATATRLTQPRNTNTPRNTTPPTTKKSPTAQMRQDFDLLKSKYAANEQVIAKQQAELELLKQQLASISPPSTPVPPSLVDQPTPPISQSNTMADLHQTQLLLDKDEALQQRDEALAELRQKLEQVTKDMAAANDNSGVAPSLDDQKSRLASLTEKERLLEEKERDLNTQLQQMEQQQQQLALEQVPSQMEKLRLENEEAARRLAIKEKELDDLRTSIQVGTPSTSGSIISDGDDQQSSVLLKLQQQLDEQKRLHGESLRQHELAVNEKEALLKAHEDELERLKATHTENIRQLKTQQTSNILKMKQKHKQELMDLQQKLDQVEQSKREQMQQQGDQAKQQQEQLDGELEKILAAFEQAEHNHTAQLQSMEDSHQTAISDLQQSHADQLQKTIGSTQGYTSKKYIPYEAVSWPAPQPLSMLRKTSGPSPRPNRVLLNTTVSSSEPILTPLDTKKVQVYISTVSGNPMIKKNQDRIQQILKSREIPFELVDVAASEIALQYMKRSNNNGSLEGRAKEVPQLFVGGEFRGLFNDVAKHDEDGTLDALLIPATGRKWTAAERQAIEKATIGTSSSLSSSSLNNNNVPLPVRVLPSGPVATPTLRQTTSKTITSTGATVDDEDEALFKELEQELDQGNVDLSQLDQL